MSPYPKVTPEEHLTLEFHYQAKNKSSFTNVSNLNKRKICDDLGEGWEWDNTLNENSIGCNRLRGWWRCRSTRETRDRRPNLEVKESLPLLQKNQGNSKKAILRDRHNSLTSYVSLEDIHDESYSIKDSSLKKGNKEKQNQLQKISTLSKSKAQCYSSSQSSAVISDSRDKNGSKYLNLHRVSKEASKERTNVDTNSTRADIPNESSIQADIEGKLEYKSDYYYTDDEMHTRQANAINENSDIIFLQPKRLQIGSWNRTNQDLEVARELNVYYSPDEEAFVFWTCHNGRFFRIILPLCTLASLKVFNSTTTSNLALLFTLNPNLSGIYGVYFETSTLNEPQWIQNPSGDFSEDRQASTTGIYSLEIDGLDDWNLALQHILISILRTSDAQGAELVRDFSRKVFWGDWKEEEFSPDELVKSMSLPQEHIDESPKSLVYANSRQEGGADLVLNSVYQYLKSEEFDAQASGMEEVRDSLLGEESDSEFSEADPENYDNVNLPSSSPQPSLYHSRSSSYEYDFDSPFYNGSQNPHPHYAYPLHNPLETYSDSFEPPTTTYGRYLNSQPYLHVEDHQSLKSYGFFHKDHYQQEYCSDFNASSFFTKQVS